MVGRAGGGPAGAVAREAEAGGRHRWRDELGWGLLGDAYDLSDAYAKTFYLGEPLTLQL